MNDKSGDNIILVLNIIGSVYIKFLPRLFMVMEWVFKVLLDNYGIETNTGNFKTQ